MITPYLEGWTRHRQLAIRRQVATGDVLDEWVPSAQRSLRTALGERLVQAGRHLIGDAVESDVAPPTPQRSRTAA